MSWNNLVYLNITIFSTFTTIPQNSQPFSQITATTNLLYNIHDYFYGRLRTLG